MAMDGQMMGMASSFGASTTAGGGAATAAAATAAAAEVRLGGGPSPMTTTDANRALADAIELRQAIDEIVETVVQGETVLSSVPPTLRQKQQHGMGKRMRLSGGAVAPVEWTGCSASNSSADFATTQCSSTGPQRLHSQLLKDTPDANEQTAAHDTKQPMSNGPMISELGLHVLGSADLQFYQAVNNAIHQQLATSRATDASQWLLRALAPGDSVDVNVADAMYSNGDPIEVVSTAVPKEKASSSSTSASARVSIRVCTNDLFRVCVSRFCWCCWCCCMAATAAYM
jgi:hypothetical protein